MSDLAKNMQDTADAVRTARDARHDWRREFNRDAHKRHTAARQHGQDLRQFATELTTNVQDFLFQFRSEFENSARKDSENRRAEATARHAWLMSMLNRFRRFRQGLRRELASGHASWMEATRCCEPSSPASSTAPFARASHTTHAGRAKSTASKKGRR